MALLLLGLSAGCGPAVSRDELGEVVFEVPTFSEDDAYSLPDLGAGAAPRTIDSPAARPAAAPQS